MDSVLVGLFLKLLQLPLVEVSAGVKITPRTTLQAHSQLVLAQPIRSNSLWHALTMEQDNFPYP